ncbi:hypothetical protein JKP88DRAFT_270814 [Tribonema minus]|uniref:phosphoribosylaminoimidazolesuccinocarboxamide synthase n=1 Tax=Tribonema minus TaxID=303371 RepID=A0A836C963_9STRA|nr:hypothetical protein JKP88DRAFT_270814 [Tribonema minus]
MGEAAVSAAVAEAQARTQEYIPRIDAARASLCVGETNIPTSIVAHEGRYVRDTYVSDDFIVLVSTDRQSAFDRALAQVPFKGAVLNQTSAWWFELSKKEGVADNHVLAVPDPNVTIGKKCAVFPIEFVMRGYMTGSTSTSIWKNYEKGVRQYCGHALPEGLRKNAKLPTGNLLTPTTKDAVHDELISAEEVVSSGRMTQEDWDRCAEISHALFALGQRVAAQRGLILVDTKYELGKDAAGNIIVVDEIHTPDSSRYWIADSYETRMAAGQEPENIDKEFLRVWFAKNCDPYNDATLPAAPAELVNELSRRYIMLYEMITGQQFQFPDPAVSVDDRINQAVAGFVASRQKA